VAQAGANRSSNLSFKIFATGLRILARTPGVSAIAILSLALGIGANAAIFSLVDRLILSILPVKQPERLVLFDYVQPYLRYKEFRNRSQLPPQARKYFDCWLPSQGYAVRGEAGAWRITGIMAPFLGKQPPDTHVWIAGGGAPAFVQSEGPCTWATLSGALK
jgi:hypothetical protein